MPARIIRFDPRGVCPPGTHGRGGDAFDPLDFIDPNEPDFLDACRDLANMLVARPENDPSGSTGAGKAVSVRIPTLLSCNRNVVVVDPQGELYAAGRIINHSVDDTQASEADPPGRP